MPSHIADLCDFAVVLYRHRQSPIGLAPRRGTDPVRHFLLHHGCDAVGFHALFKYLHDYGRGYVIRQVAYYPYLPCSASFCPVPVNDSVQVGFEYVFVYYLNFIPAGESRFQHGNESFVYLYGYEFSGRIGRRLCQSSRSRADLYDQVVFCDFRTLYYIRYDAVVLKKILAQAL